MILLLSAAGCGLINDKDYNISEDWLLPKRLGKDFWFMLNLQWRDLPGVNDEEFVKNAGITHVVLSSRPSYNPLIIRELKIFGKNNSSLAFNVRINGKSNGLTHPERIMDNDFNSFAYDNLNSCESIKSEIIFEFDKENVIQEIRLSHGYKRFQNDSNPCCLISNFKFQYWSGMAWENIFQAEMTDNKHSENIFGFDPVRTKSVKLSIDPKKFSSVITAVDEGMLQGRPFYLWNFQRYSDGGYKSIGMDKRLDSGYIKEQYKAIKEKYKDGCLGFMLGEWDNDINWAGNQRLGQLKEFIALRKWFQKKYPLSSLPPKTKKQACELLEDICKYQKGNLFNDVFGMNGGFCFDHYNLEWGGNIAAVENSVCSLWVDSYNMARAFARGAARQYHKEWMSYDAYYLLGASPNYLIGSIPLIGRAKNEEGPDYGLPVSLGRRSQFHSYYAGVTYLDFESQPEAFVQDINNDGVYELSPHGKVLEEVFNFTKKHPQRGVPYTPIALVLDYYHGWGWNGNKLYRARECSWYTVPYEDSDYMIKAVMQNVWPYCSNHYPDLISEHSDGCIGLVNTPYGDIFDVLVANPPGGTISLNTLDNYKVLFLLGDIRMDSVLSRFLMEYVGKGGILVMNSKQINEYFPEKFLGVRLLDVVDTGFYSYPRIKLSGAVPLMENDKQDVVVTRNSYGKGYLLLALPFYLIDKNKKSLPVVAQTMAYITEEILPVKVTGDVGYQVNKKDDNTWIVVLMNNKGVTKDKYKPEEFDYSKTAKVKIVFKGKIKKATELIGEENVACQKTGNNSLINLTVLAGDVKVLEIVR